MALLGSACLHQGKHTEAWAWAEQANELGAATGGAIGEAHGLLVMGQALQRQGQSERARELLERTVVLARRRQQGEPPSEQLSDTEFIAYNWLCSIALSRNDYAAAARYVERGMELCRRLRKRRGITLLHSDMVDIAFAAGDYTAARGHGEKALRLARGLGYRHIEGSMLCTLACLARLRGDYSLALDLALQALPCFQRAGDLVWEAIVSNEIGYVRALLGDSAGAQAWLDRAEHTLEAADSPPRELAQNALRRAQLAYAAGDHARALVCVTRAVELARGLEGSSGLVEALAVLGAVQARLDRPERAAPAFEEALALNAKRTQRAAAALPHAGLAKLAQRRGEMGLAMEHADALWQLLVVQQAQLDEPFGPHLACAGVLAAAGDSRAEALLDQARRLCDQYAGRIADPALRTSFLNHVARYPDLAGAGVQARSTIERT